MAQQLLSDVTVLDLTWHISGPYCTKLMADYGAEVIKVERPGEGDPARRMGPFLGDDPHPEKSGLFLHLNTNKKGITLNLKSEWGKESIKRLVAKADILVESFTPGVMERLGLGYEVLEQVNPRLVVTSISNFGQTGPYRLFKASELIHNGMGGDMYSCGLPEREPLKLGSNVVQYQSGTMAAAATMIAFYAARYQGVGQQVDISIMETQLGTIDRRAPQLLAYQYVGEVTPRNDPRRRMMYPYGIFPCQDGYVDLVGGVLFWGRVVKAMGLDPEEMARFGNPLGQYNEELREEFYNNYWWPWILDKTKEEVLAATQGAKLYSAPLNTAEDLVNDPHWRERGYFVEIDHPAAGRLTYTGAPVRSPSWQIRRPAPLLGEHNEEVYTKILGCSKADLVRLAERGAI
ncbi:MAG: CoA transferase [Chloroflexota bacterium]|nr:CoA transferase [Chloroflexota bacterium]